MTDGLLLLHAWPLDARMWDPQRAAAPAAVAVVAPNLPGFGGAEPAGDVMTMTASAERALAAMDEAGIDRAVVCGLSIGGYVAFRAVTRDDLEVEPQTVDYLEAVGFAQEADLTVVYPPTVPEGWQATSVESQPGRQWGIGFLTPDGFAGVHQSEAGSSDLLETYVDEDPIEGDPVTIAGSEWETWTDDGGDVAYLGDVEGQQVLVYGSAPPAALQSLAASLTTAPLQG